MAQLKLGVLASGRGSNFAALVAAIQQRRLTATVRVLISNKEDAGALAIAQQNGIPALFLSPKAFASTEHYDDEIARTFIKYNVNFVVLAGYLRLLSVDFIRTYTNRIINIHPALLPAFGGKGMYGIHVHEAVLAHGCKVSGVTLHLVDEIFDHGPIILQRCVPVLADDTPETLAARVLVQEHQIYAEALQLFAEGRVKIEGCRARILPGSCNEACQ